MGRHLATTKATPTLLSMLLAGACTPTAGPGAAPSTDTGSSFGEPPSTQQVLQGIQIGEGGDQLPCEANLLAVEEPDVDSLFAGLPGAWAALPYATEGTTGTADLTLVLDGTWQLTWSDLEGSSADFDCGAETPVWVAGLWLGIDGSTLSAQVPVFARAIDQPASDFVGEVASEALGLGAGDPYHLWGRVDGAKLVVDVYTDLLYGSPVGSFGGAR